MMVAKTAFLAVPGLLGTPKDPPRSVAKCRRHRYNFRDMHQAKARAEAEAEAEPRAEPETDRQAGSHNELKARSHNELQADPPAESETESRSQTESRSEIQTKPNAEKLPSLSLGDADTKCGFAALLGPTNTGKSTLLNRIMGTKVAIVSPKVQTTRCRVLGIHVEGDTQVVFQDTPGLFDPKTRLDRAMVRSAWSTGQGADVLAIVLDINEFFRNGTGKLNDRNAQVVDTYRKRKERGELAETFLALNKIDRLPPHIDADEWCTMAHESVQDLVTQTFRISAKTGQGVDALKNAMYSKMPRGPFLYPEDDLTDMPLRLMAAEITREQLFLQLRQELPYDSAVETISWDEYRNGSVRIEQKIYVKRSTQVGMITGKSGHMIKSISMNARAAIDELLGRKCHLIINVKHRPKWKEDESLYSPWGLDFDA